MLGKFKGKAAIGWNDVHDLPISSCQKLKFVSDVKIKKFFLSITIIFLKFLSVTGSPAKLRFVQKCIFGE